MASLLRHLLTLPRGDAHLDAQSFAIPSQEAVGVMCCRQRAVLGSGDVVGFIPAMPRWCWGAHPAPLAVGEVGAGVPGSEQRVLS